MISCINTDYRVGNVTIAVCDVNDVAPQFINTIFTAGRIICVSTADYFSNAHILAVSVTTDLGDTIFQLRVSLYT